MRRLIADLYKIVYKLTRNKAIAFFFALFYITVLNLFILYGIFDLLLPLNSYLAYAQSAFRMPYLVLTSAALLAFNFWLMLPLQNLTKERSKPPAALPIVIYSLVAFLLIFYSFYLSDLI